MLPTYAIATLLMLGPLAPAAQPHSARIVGGQHAHRGQFPYQIELFINEVPYCGGAIVAARWIVTAANCMLLPDPQHYTVLAGAVRLSGDSGKRYQVAAVFDHGYVNGEQLLNDIALLRLTEDIEMSETVQSVPFDAKFVTYGHPAVVSGWGLTWYPGGSHPDVLRYLNVTTLSNLDCLLQLGTKLPDTQMCAYANRLFKGTCIGDSGDPLVSDGRLIGVVSWTRPCARGTPDVYERISSHVQWMRDTIGA